MKESKLSKLVSDFVVMHNGFVFNVTGSTFQKAGMPDLYIAHEYLPNRDMWVELKVEKNKLTNIQKLAIKQLRERKVYACWLRYTEADGYFVGYGDEFVYRANDLQQVWNFWLHGRV